MNSSFDKAKIFPTAAPGAVVVGAGVAGLVAAIELTLRGHSVEVLEVSSRPGGKMREIEVGGRSIDAGPTVLTMHWVFEQLFERAGVELGDYVRLLPAALLARHAWPDGSTLDLHADLERTVDAIGVFAGAADARGYRAFAEHTARIYEAVRGAFLLGQRPSLWTMMRDPAVRTLSPLSLDAHRSMMRSLAGFFRDPRLIQLFGRYATYVGSSPFQAPGTLSLIAHVERQGVHYVEGGMARLADALVALATARGVRIRYGCQVRSIEASAGRVRAVRFEAEGTLHEEETELVVFAGDVGALAGGLLGPSVQGAVDYDSPPAKRSLSALTLSAVARVSGFPLVRHNVFFGEDSAEEFRDLFERRTLPRSPTVYVCAQDRTDQAVTEPGHERLFFIVNAPADADVRTLTEEEIEACQRAMNTTMQRSGMTLEIQAQRHTTPSEFARLFPGSAGALYGRASHGMLAALSRPSARCKLKGLYLAGGSVHPGAGVPMAALSGIAAAQAIETDSRSSGT